MASHKFIDAVTIFQILPAFLVQDNATIYLREAGNLRGEPAKFCYF